MQIVKPDLTLIPQPDGLYNLFSITQTPSSCYSAGPARVGLPPGYVVTPETLPVILELRHRDCGCLAVITPVRHFLPGLKLGNSHGKRQVTAFVVLDGSVLGISSTTIDRALDDESVERLGLGKGCFPTFDWYAWDNQQPPGHALHVTGQVLVPTPCYTAKLERAVLVDPPPQQYPLILEVERTSDVCITIPTIIPVRFDDEEYQGGYDTVGIYQGECAPIVIGIDEVS